MYNEIIETIILKELKQNPDKYYSIQKLKKLINFKRHTYDQLKETLTKMRKRELLLYINKKYKLFDELKAKQKRYKYKETLIGTVDATPLARDKSYIFVRTDVEDIYVDIEDINGSVHEDTVVIEVKKDKRDRKSGKILEVKKRKRDNIVGDIIEYNNKFILIPDNSKIHLSFNIDKINNAKNGQKVILKINNWINGPSGDVIEILGKASDPAIKILGVIKHFDIPLEFPKDVIKEVNLINENITQHEINKRYDFRDIETFTIDPSSAKDFDDAISLVENKDEYIIYTHIADVSHYVNIKSKIFEEATERCNSFYFPKKVIPMIPPRLSNKICSLRPNEDKLVLSVITRMNKKFDITDQRVVEGIINSDYRFNYDEIDNYFNNKEHNIPDGVNNTLDTMLKISNNLNKKRYIKGYIHFELPEVEFIFDDYGEIINLNRSKETDSHKLIENFMLLANEYIAELLSKKAKATIFRIHDTPDYRKLQKIKNILSNYDIDFYINKNLNQCVQNVLYNICGKDEHRVFDKMILRSLRKAKYSIENKGHFGLGDKFYTHFTSPIRRLCDLVVHHQIKRFVIQKNSKPKFSIEDLKRMSYNSSDQEVKAMQAERDVNTKNVNAFMKNKIGEEYIGIIFNIDYENIYVELDDIPVVGKIEIKSLIDDIYSLDKLSMILHGRKINNNFKLTDKLLVKIINVGNEITFEIVKK